MSNIHPEKTLLFEQIQGQLGLLKILLDPVNAAGISLGALKSQTHLSQQVLEEMISGYQQAGFSFVKSHGQQETFFKLISGFSNNPPIKLMPNELFYRFFVMSCYNPGTAQLNYHFSTNQKEILFNYLDIQHHELMDIYPNLDMTWSQMKVDFTLLLPRINLINEAIMSRSLVLFEMSDLNSSSGNIKSFFPLEFFSEEGSYYVATMDSESGEIVPMLLEEITKMGLVEKNCRPQVDFDVLKWLDSQDPQVFNRRREKIVVFFDEMLTQYVEKYRPIQNCKRLHWTRFADSTSSLEVYLRVSQEVVHWLKEFACHLEVVLPEKYQVCSQVSTNSYKKRLLS